MCHIGKQVKITPSKVVYDNTITSLVDDAPCDSWVVTNKKYHGKLQERRHAGNSYRVTFTDKVKYVCSAVTNDLADLYIVLH